MAPVPLRFNPDEVLEWDAAVPLSTTEAADPTLHDIRKRRLSASDPFEGRRPPEISAQSPYQDQLIQFCRNNGLRLPVYKIVSDRRGGRTAWSCTVDVDGQPISARFWYDGQYINNAREDAAQRALERWGQSGGIDPSDIPLHQNSVQNHDLEDHEDLSRSNRHQADLDHWCREAPSLELQGKTPPWVSPPLQQPYLSNDTGHASLVFHQSRNESHLENEEPPVRSRWTSLPVCWILVLIGTMVIGGSLAVGLYYSIAKDNMDGGFTVASWMIAVGTLVLAGPVTKHYPNCRCWE